MKIALLGCGRVAEHYADKVLNKEIGVTLDTLF